ncbi:MAG: alpha/beta fold hydrolase [Eubacteriales bacterium]|nr:alpha/beta fold hydrolase [Eubacteriales bacterium]
MFARVNGCRIFFDVEGLQYIPDGPVMREKPVCLVLHGGPGADHTHFMPDLSPLSEVCQLIYIDDRNTGRSERTDVHTSSIRQNVEDIEALREYLGLDKVFILGQSYGGMKAQYYVSHYPEHLYGAMILSTGSNAAAIANSRVAEHVREYGTEEQYRTWTSGDVFTGKMSFDEYLEIMLPLYHGKGKIKLDEAITASKRGLKNDDVVQYQFGNELACFDLRPDLKNVKVPCVIVCGEKDFICDVDANREIAETIPGAEFHVIPEASHEVIADYPEIVFPILKDFIDRHFQKQQA